MSTITKGVVVAFGVLAALYLTAVMGLSGHLVNRSVLYPADCADKKITVSLSRDGDGHDRILVSVPADPLFTKFGTTKLIVTGGAIERDGILDAVALPNEEHWARSVVATTRETSFPVAPSELSRCFIVIRFIRVSRFLPATTTEFIMPVAAFSERAEAIAKPSR